MNLKPIFARLYLVASLIAVAYFGWSFFFHEKKVVHDIQVNEIQRTDSLRHYKDVAGREHGQRVLAEGSKVALKVAFRKEIDSLVVALDIKEKQLQAFTMASTLNEGTVRLRVDTIYRDSTTAYRFAYNDRWLDISGTVGKESLLNYKIKDSLVFSTYWKRRWFLGRKTNYIDAYSQNPNVKMVGLEGARVKVNEPGRMGLGPFIGYGYNGRTWAPTVGFSFHYSIIRF